jgi:hypothetical protein
MEQEKKERLEEERAGLVDEVLSMYELAKQQDTKLSETEFIRKNLPFHPATWSKIQNNRYPGDLTIKLQQIRHAIYQMQSELACESKVASVKAYRMMHAQQAVLDAITVARKAQNENRLVIFMAPTGGGKSELCRYLAAKKNAFVFESKESWRDSYSAFIHDVCAGLKTRNDSKTKRGVELKMLTRLTMYEHLLAFDESATAFGGPTANGIKLILNQTRSIVVMCGTLELVSRMMRTSEGAQLIRRCVQVIKIEKITSQEAKPFLPYTWSNESECLKMAVNAANQFGMFDTLTRLNDVLAMDYQPGDQVEQRELAKALNIVRSQVGLID